MSSGHWNMNNFTRWVNKQLHYTDLQDLLPPRARHIRKHIFYGNILIWNTGTGRGSINTHQQQRWPCEDMGLSRVNQQNNRAGNRWSIFNIRMKIIKMFTMKINIVLAVRKSISAGKVKLKCGQSGHYCNRTRGETEHSRPESGDRLWLIIHHYR